MGFLFLIKYFSITFINADGIKYTVQSVLNGRLLLKIKEAVSKL
jgi:hypothetical protein